MSKHTPGPWIVVGRGTTIQMGDRCFAGVDQNVGVPFSEATANAHLIAAAPELLAALKHARMMVYMADLGPSADSALAMYDAGITKAEGES